MQIGFRENNMPGQDKTRRETDNKCNHPRADFRRNFESPIDISYLPVQDEPYGNIFDKNIKDSVRAATGKVTESLGRDKPRKRDMTKINNPKYDMSDFFKQFSLFGCKSKINFWNKSFAAHRFIF